MANNTNTQIKSNQRIKVKRWSLSTNGGKFVMIRGEYN